MNLFQWMLILVPSVGLAIAGLFFAISYAKRDPKKERENIEMLANVDKMEREGKLDPEDARIIRESV